MKIRVYYEDTDCGNVVYYANYLKYMERARTEFMREQGIDLEEYHKRGYVFAVVEAHMKYRKSAHYNDLIEEITKIIDVSSLALTFETTFYNEHNEVLARGTAKMVCIDTTSGKACKGPADMTQKLREIINKTS